MIDAQDAIKLNAEFAKGYYREAAALQQVDEIEEALRVLMLAPEKVREDAGVKRMIEDLQKEYKEDNLLPRGMFRDVKRR